MNMNDSASNISKEQRTNISDLFQTMNESSATSSHSNLAKHWLETCGCFTGFVDGKWMSSTTSEGDSNIEIAKGLTTTVKWASSNEIAAAIENSQEGFRRWQEHVDKAKVLYRISQCIEQHSKLLNAIDGLTKYGCLREKYNSQYLIESFQYYSWLVGNEELSRGWKPTGVVCVVCDNDRFVSSLWVVAAALAAGNAVICLVELAESLSPFLLVQLCNSAGLPAGVFNVVRCNVSSLSNSLKVDKIILSSPNPQAFLSGDLKKVIPCEIIPNQWPCVIVYESADIDAVISSILDTMLIFDAKKPWPICKVYLQESVQKKFIKLLTLKICGSVGCNADYKPPFYFMGREVTTAQVERLLAAYNADGGTEDIFSVSKSSICEEESLQIPAAVINFNSKPEQNQSIRCGPGIYIEQFRTVKESIAMFNQSKKNSNVSIWSEEMYLLLEVASRLKSRTVWVNCQNVYDPSITNGSLYLSGNSNIGGKEGVFSHLLCSEQNKGAAKCVDSKEVQSYGSQAPSSSVIPIKNNEEKKIERCVKLYIGGSFVNSNCESFQEVFDANSEPYAYVASGHKSDVDKAVSSASSSQPKWENVLKIKRAAVFRKASELLSKRKEEFVLELCTLTGRSKEFSSQEVEQAVSILIDWANYIAHFDSRIVETKFHGKVFQEYQPLGIIGIQCPDEEPLLSFVFFVAPAIIFGNAVVALPSEKYPTCAFKMCEVFQAAGLLGGVLNVVSSSRAYLSRHLSSHLNIDAVWFTEDGADFIYDSYHSIQPKKIFNCKNVANSMDKLKIAKFQLESTYSKAVFIPMGTGFT